jgi:phosphomannomutase
MTLIKSISGIRGTIGGSTGEALTPIDLVKYTSAFAQWVKKQNNKESITIVLGRDARISGDMVAKIVSGSLMANGCTVIDLGLSSTPTTEMAVPELKAQGGIILTASHNPKQWNALKLLNHKGEFISANDGKDILDIAVTEQFLFAEIDKIGQVEYNHSMLQMHIDKILDLPLVDKKAIQKARLKVVVDGINSVGGITIPELLLQLGVSEVITINCEPTGVFAHNPEPLPENLTGIAEAVTENKAHLGIVVDPDVDRLAIINEDGSMFGEEYTLVAVADYVLHYQKGATVSNLSSSRALKDVAQKHNCDHHAAAVGEVNVVEKMKDVNAVIGGEGNGGVIYPESHYGRDALVGTALFLTHLVKSGKSCSDLRKTYPEYVISKNKLPLGDDTDLDEILNKIKALYKDQPVNDIDGVRIEFDKEWVHLRKSNTEPIIRIYAESTTKEDADKLANKIILDINKVC